MDVNISDLTRTKETAMKPTQFKLSTILVLFTLFLVSCGGSSSDNNSSGGEPSPDNTTTDLNTDPDTEETPLVISSGIKLSGTIRIPGGTKSDDNPRGLQPAAEKTVKLYYIDNDNILLGDLIDTTTSDAQGVYEFTLPENADFVSNLIVEAILDNQNNQAIRAIVTDETTDITPSSEFIAAKLINDPIIDLTSLPIEEVIKLIAEIEKLDIEPQQTLSETLAEIEAKDNQDTQAEIDLLSGIYYPRIVLSGTLNIPTSSSGKAARLIPSAVIHLFQIDGEGAIIGESLATTTTNNNGEYTLELPKGLTLSSDLIIRSTVGSDTVSALVVSETLNIDAVSQYVYNRIINDPHLPPELLVVNDIYKIVEDIEQLTFTEENDLQLLLDQINL